MSTRFSIHTAGILIILTVLTAGFSLSGCTTHCKRTNLTELYSELQTHNNKMEIIREEKNIQKQMDKRSESLLKLSLLYAHHNNSDPDYQLALKRLEGYISLCPEEGNTEQTQFILSLLKQIEVQRITTERLKTRIDNLNAALEQIKSLSQDHIKKESAHLKNENEFLQKENENLNRENQEMKIIIEKLKHLDIRLEQQRKKLE